MVLYRLRRAIARRFFPMRFRVVSVPVTFDQPVSILVRRG